MRETNAARKLWVMLGTTINTVANYNLHGATTKQINVVGKLKCNFIIGLFLFCYTPICVLKVLTDLYYEKNSVRVFIKTRSVLCFLNCAINPVLYAWRFAEAMFQFKRMLFFWSPNQLRIPYYEIETISRVRATSTR